MFNSHSHNDSLTAHATLTQSCMKLSSTLNPYFPLFPSNQTMLEGGREGEGGGGKERERERERGGLRQRQREYRGICMHGVDFSSEVARPRDAEVARLRTNRERERGRGRARGVRGGSRDDDTARAGCLPPFLGHF